MDENIPSSERPVSAPAVPTEVATATPEPATAPRSRRRRGILISVIAGGVVALGIAFGGGVALGAALPSTATSATSGQFGPQGGGPGGTGTGGTGTGTGTGTGQPPSFGGQQPGGGVGTSS